VTTVYIAEISLSHRFVGSAESSARRMNRMLAEGRIQTYGLSKDLTRMWVTFLAANEGEAWEIAVKLPVHGVTDPIVTPLSTYNQSLDLRFPTIVWN